MFQLPVDGAFVMYSVDRERNASFDSNCRDHFEVNGFLAALEQKDGNLTQIEINEVPGFVSDVGPKITADDAMPCWVVFFIEFLKK